MQINTISPQYHVAGQITPDDIPAIAKAGFRTVICNRPDAEIPAELSAETIGAAARKAGLAFHVLELTHQTMTPENVALQKTLANESDGPVLAYCASGTRCSVIWALGNAAELGVNEVLNRTRAAGYDLEALRPRLESVST